MASKIGFWNINDYWRRVFYPPQPQPTTNVEEVRMASFEDILKDINTGTQALGTVLPTVSATGIGSLQSISTIIATAGATVASTTKDQTIAAESIAATQTALALLPLIFGLFHKSAQAKS